MNFKIFELYDFIVANNCEVHCYGAEDDEVIVFIERNDSYEFLEILDRNFSSLFDDGGLEAKIVHDGSICIDLMKCIGHYCHSEESEKWFEIFKRHSTD